ncbi:MAG: LptF/LptG family permease, partial [Burkholderiales bacterium]
MNTLRNYLAREIYGATLFVFVAFLALFAFFDLINELGDLGRGSYRLQYVLAVVALTIPGHVYELFPVVVLIGTLYALSRLAANSEYTVMSGSGLAPW